MPENSLEKAKALYAANARDDNAVIFVLFSIADSLEKIAASAVVMSSAPAETPHP